MRVGGCIGDILSVFFRITVMTVEIVCKIEPEIKFARHSLCFGALFLTDRVLIPVGIIPLLEIVQIWMSKYELSEDYFFLGFAWIFYNY